MDCIDIHYIDPSEEITSGNIRVDIPCKEIAEQRETSYPENIYLM